MGGEAAATSAARELSSLDQLIDGLASETLDRILKDTPGAGPTKAERLERRLLGMPSPPRARNKGGRKKEVPQIKQEKPKQLSKKQLKAEERRKARELEAIAEDLRRKKAEEEDKAARRAEREDEERKRQAAERAAEAARVAAEEAEKAESAAAKRRLEQAAKEREREKARTLKAKQDELRKQREDKAQADARRRAEAAAERADRKARAEAEKERARHDAKLRREQKAEAERKKREAKIAEERTRREQERAEAREQQRKQHEAREAAKVAERERLAAVAERQQLVAQAAQPATEEWPSIGDTIRNRPENAAPDRNPDRLAEGTGADPAAIDDGRSSRRKEEKKSSEVPGKAEDIVRIGPGNAASGRTKPDPAQLQSTALDGSQRVGAEVPSVPTLPHGGDTVHHVFSNLHDFQIGQTPQLAQPVSPNLAAPSYVSAEHFAGSNHDHAARSNVPPVDSVGHDAPSDHPSDVWPPSVAHQPPAESDPSSLWGPPQATSAKGWSQSDVSGQQFGWSASGTSAAEGQPDLWPSMPDPIGHGLSTGLLSSSNIGGPLPTTTVEQRPDWFGERGREWPRQDDAQVVHDETSAAWDTTGGLTSGDTLPWADAGASPNLGWEDDSLRKGWPLDGTTPESLDPSPWGVSSLLNHPSDSDRVPTAGLQQTDWSAPGANAPDNHNTWGSAGPFSGASDGWDPQAHSEVTVPATPWGESSGRQSQRPAPPGLAPHQSGWSGVPVSKPFCRVTPQEFASAQTMMHAPIVGLDGASAPTWGNGGHTGGAPSWGLPSVAVPTQPGGLTSSGQRCVLTVHGFVQMADARKVRAFVEGKFKVCGYSEVSQMGCVLIELANEIEATLVKDLIGQIRMSGQLLHVDFASPDVEDSFKLLQQQHQPHVGHIDTLPRGVPLTAAPGQDIFPSHGYH